MFNLLHYHLNTITGTHLHGNDPTWNELFVLPDGKMPAPNSHKVIKRELQDEPALSHHLE